MRNPTSAVQTSLNEHYINKRLMYLIQILTKHIKVKVSETKIIMYYQFQKS